MTENQQQPSPQHDGNPNAAGLNIDVSDRDTHGNPADRKSVV